MLGKIFKRWDPGRKSGGSDLGPSQEPSSSHASASGAPIPAVPADRTMLAIDRELSALAQLPVAQAAKERCWAALQRELERHPVRTGPAHARPSRTAGFWHRWRWVLASAAAGIAVIAALLGTYSGGLLQTADSDDQTTTVTSVVASDTTEPPTTVSTDSTPASSGSSLTSEQQVLPSSTDTVSTDGSATTVGPPTTGSSPNTTRGNGPGTTVVPSVNTTTTRPPSTTTTGEQQMAATQREGSARTATASLAELVTSGNTSGARALVAPEAQSALAQMMMSLSDPHGYRIADVRSLSDTVVRVTLEIKDRVVSPNGELKEALPKFAIRVRVDDNGAVITAINAG